MNDGSRLRHAVGRSKSAALKDLLSASCLPILIRLRSSKLGSGGLGIWATILAMSDEKASDTCGGGRRWGGGEPGMGGPRRPWRAPRLGSCQGAPVRCAARRPQSTCSCASGQTPAPRRLPPEAGEGAAQFVAGSLVARRNASSSRVGCVCRHASSAHAGLHKARAAPTCGSPSALLPTMTRGRPGLAASTCGRWGECELRGSAQYGGRRGP